MNQSVLATWSATGYTGPLQVVSRKRQVACGRSHYKSSLAYQVGGQRIRLLHRVAVSATARRQGARPRQRNNTTATNCTEQHSTTCTYMHIHTHKEHSTQSRGVWLCVVAFFVLCVSFRTPYFSVVLCTMCAVLLFVSQRVGDWCVGVLVCDSCAVFVICVVCLLVWCVVCGVWCVVCGVWCLWCGGVLSGSILCVFHNTPQASEPASNRVCLASRGRPNDPLLNSWQTE